MQLIMCRFVPILDFVNITFRFKMTGQCIEVRKGNHTKLQYLIQNDIDIKLTNQLL